MNRLLVFALLLALPLRADEPKTARDYVLRGIENFRAAKIKESIDDFETACRLNARMKAQLWQLGISYYYAGEFKKGRELFELHQTVNPQDVENAIWHFLCITKADRIETARKKFIPITNDPRVPMKELHQLFAGQGSAEEVLRAAQTGDPGQQREQLFYAHLYLGLYEEALKHPVESLAHMKLAAGEFRSAHYMGDVARVHVKLRSPSP
jgi:lipoprotein NlpI